MSMNRAQLLAAMESLAAEKPLSIEIKGLGKIFVRQLTIGEMEAQMADAAAGKKGLARNACRLLCDENGAPILNPENEEDVRAMAKLPIRVLVAINATIGLDEASAAKS